jgi:deazaflavin-dependent oxidoreductase (nitroreductase family)
MIRAGSIGPRRDVDSNEWNRAVIQEFRANGGKCGGQCEGADMVIITTTGATSGLMRENPLESLADGDRVIIFASNAGAPRNPDWYYNLVANPTVTVERGTETYEARATVLTGGERDRLYAKQASLLPSFAEYEQQTSRTIPVISLTRV